MEKAVIEKYTSLIERLERNDFTAQEFIDEFVPVISKIVTYLQVSQSSFEKRMDVVERKTEQLIEDLQAADIMNGIAREFLESRGLITEFHLYMDRTLEAAIQQIKTVH